MRPSQIQAQERGNAAFGAAGKCLGSGKVGCLGELPPPRAGKKEIKGVGDPGFPTWAGKWGGMLSPGCQEKQDTLQDQNPEFIFHFCLG